MAEAHTNMQNHTHFVNNENNNNLNNKTLSPLNSSKLVFKPNPNLTAHKPLNEIKFGNQFTDHILYINWNENEGWTTPIIEAMGPMPLHPAISSLHYGLQVFEGMKAYKGDNGKCYLFRPHKNLERLNKSAKRLNLPNFDCEEFLQLLKKVIMADEHHIPYSETLGYSLYVRPFMFSTHAYLGVGPPSSACLSVIMCPAASYFSNVEKSIKILATTDYARSFPGSAGDAKVGGNYAPTIQPMAEAAQHGFSQILWLHKTMNDYIVTEAGTMNIFFVMMNEEGKKMLVTPKLEQNLILPGITRDSILELTKEYDDFDIVSEQTLYMKGDIVKAFEEGRMLEVFGAGTAAIVSPITTIEFNEVEYTVPFYTEYGPMGIGPLSNKIKQHILSIQYGKIPHPWAVPLN